MDLAFIVEIALVLVAGILTFFSLNTLQMLAQIGLNKSLFIPVMVSAAFFWYGSIVRVVFRICLESTPTLMVAQEVIDSLSRITWLIGLTILTYGVFSYWSITKHVKVPKYKRSRRKKSETATENDD